MGCIVPGRVVILLSGRFRGRRVVVLKNLPSGLLLVTGPYKLNGVPLKRVNEAYVIPTSTTIDVKSALSAGNPEDDFFKRTKAKRAKKGEDAFFNGAEKTDADKKNIDA